MNQTFLLLAVSELIAILLNDSVNKNYNKKIILSFLFFVSFIAGIFVHIFEIPFSCYDANLNCY